MKKLTVTLLTCLFVLSPDVVFGETVKWDDLIYREGLRYKKFTDVPFTGKVTGRQQGKIKDGKKEGPWVYYWENGQLSFKGTYKDGKEEGPWVGFNLDGTVWEEYTRTFKDGKYIK